MAIRNLPFPQHGGDPRSEKAKVQVDIINLNTKGHFPRLAILFSASRV
jgi:hypothetical protein